MSKTNTHVMTGIIDWNRTCFMCLHCGETFVQGLPISAKMFVIMGRQFSKQHDNCPTPEQPIDMDALLAAVKQKEKERAR